jgi:hypothetical protein
VPLWRSGCECDCSLSLCSIPLSPLCALVVAESKSIRFLCFDLTNLDKPLLFALLSAGGQTHSARNKTKREGGGASSRARSYLFSLIGSRCLLCFCAIYLSLSSIILQ